MVRISPRTDWIDTYKVAQTAASRGLPHASIADNANGHTRGQASKAARKAGRELREAIKVTVLLRRVDCRTRSNKMFEHIGNGLSGARKQPTCVKN